MTLDRLAQLAQERRELEEASGALTDAIHEATLEARAGGVTLAAIAQALGVTRQRVHQITRSRDS